MLGWEGLSTRLMLSCCIYSLTFFLAYSHVTSPVPSLWWCHYDDVTMLSPCGADCAPTCVIHHLWFIELPNHILHFPILEALRLHGDWFWVVNGSRSRIVSTNSFRTACKWKPWCGTTMWWVAGYCWAWNSDRMTVYTKCWCTLPCEELGLCETT